MKMIEHEPGEKDFSTFVAGCGWQRGTVVDHLCGAVFFDFTGRVSLVNMMDPTVTWFRCTWRETDWTIGRAA